MSNIVNYSLANRMMADTVAELAGSPKRSILRELVPVEMASGPIFYLPAIDAANSDAATTTDSTSVTTRESYEGIATPSLSDWVANQTPFMATARQKTVIQPYTLEWGHTWGKNEDIYNKVNQQSWDMKIGFEKIVLQQETQIINALAAANVSRVISGQTSGNDTNATNVAMPASQQFNTANSGYVDLVDISNIQKKYEDQYVRDRIYALVNPAVKKGMIDNNPEINDTDFVNSHSYFHSGELPEIYGVTFITHPLMPTDKVYTWSEGGIILGRWKNLETNVGPAATQRFGTVAYMDEVCDVKRNDDLRCLQVTII